MRLRLAALGLATVLVAAACGGTSVQGEPRPHAGPKLPPPGRFLAVDAAAHRVTITLIANYTGANGGYNFDGYSRELLFRVPRGWTVDVVCTNRGSIPHSCAVVDGAGTTRLAFAGASTPQPQDGLVAGRTARFSFRASRVGHYRITCLVPGHEEAAMWDVLDVSRGGKPAAVSLLAAA